MDWVKLSHWSPFLAGRSRSEPGHLERDSGFPCQLRSSQSVLCMPSSWSSSSRSPAQVLDRSSSVDLVEVVSWICDLCGLPPTPAEGKEMLGFRVAQDPDSHPSSSYHLPMGDTSPDILADIDDCISSPLLGMWLKEVLKLLPYAEVRSRQYYRVEEE